MTVKYLEGNPLDTLGYSITDGFHARKVSEINLETNPSEAIATISGAIEQVATNRAAYGALQNRLEYSFKPYECC